MSEFSASSCNVSQHSVTDWFAHTAIIITIGPANFFVFMAYLALSMNLKPTDDVLAQDQSLPKPATSLTSFLKAFQMLMYLEIPLA
jgi:hypothetical protein